jgi:hypothetical protein
MYASPITHFLGITTVRRLRLLPVPGKIVVRKGQKVSASDTVAVAPLGGDHLLLETARGLGISPRKANEYIVRQIGEEVVEGDVIAGPVGIGRRVVRAPQSGKIVDISSSQVLLQVKEYHEDLKAGIPGIVTELLGDHGVEIETVGALVQCVWGNGGVDTGLLIVLARSPEDILAADRLDVSQRGSVVFAGHLRNPEVLKTAAEIPLRGLILGSMDSALIPLAEKAKFPIAVIEGFGNIPINPVVYTLLTTNEQREAAVNAEPWDRLNARRPEVVIPLPAGGNVTLPIETDKFSKEQHVRVVYGEHKGMLGKIVSLKPGLTTFPSGIHTPGAEISLEGGENVVLPLANLEVLE